MASSRLAQAYTVRVWGIETPRRSPSSTTAPTTASNSIGRPERQIAENLYPDLVPNARCYGATQAGFDQSISDSAAAFGPGAVGLTERNPVPFGVMDDARLYDIGFPDKRAKPLPSGDDGSADDASGIDPFERRIIERGAFTDEWF